MRAIELKSIMLLVFTAALGGVASTYAPPGVIEFANDFVFQLTDGNDLSARCEKT